MNKVFYQVKGTFFRTVANEVNPVEINQIFRDENPIVAREKAFRFYQNYIDVFLESRGQVYVSHKQTIKELQDFMNSYKTAVFKIGGLILETDFDKGAAIYLVESPETVTTVDKEVVYEDKKLIHYIDKKEIVEYRQILLNNLQYEYAVYQKEGYDCKGYETEHFCLRTPIYSKRYIH